MQRLAAQRELAEDLVVAAEPVIYREEVSAILFALSDIVVELRTISDLLREDDDEEEEAD